MFRLIFLAVVVVAAPPPVDYALKLKQGEVFADLRNIEYPAPYGDDKPIVWKFESDPGSKIQIKCEDFRVTETDDCKAIGIQIITEEGTQTYCKQYKAFKVVSPSNTLIFMVKGNGSGQAAFSCYVKSTQPPPAEEVEVRLNEVFHFGSPEHPQPFFDKVWQLTAEKNLQVDLSCDINLLEMSPCHQDVITIDVGEGPQEYCGFVKKLLFSKGKSATVRLELDRIGNGRVHCIAQAAEKQIKPDTQQVDGDDSNKESKDKNGENGKQVKNEEGQETNDQEKKEQKVKNIEPKEIKDEKTNDAFDLSDIKDESIVRNIAEDSSEHGGISGTRGTTCDCGWANKPKGRIILGNEAAQNEYPWMVVLKVHFGNKYGKCGGSIITHRHVITAAHCLIDLDGDRSPVKPEDLVIIVGAHNLDKFTPKKNYREYRAEQHFIRPEFPLLLIHDFALIVVEKEISFSNFVGPICLSPSSINEAQKHVTIVGWGKTETGKGSSVLLKAKTKVIESSLCRIMPWEVCTRSQPSSTCSGDSGGPLVWLDPETNRYTQLSLVSYGHPDCVSSPSVSTDVAYYYDWLLEKIRATYPEESPCIKV